MLCDLGDHHTSLPKFKIKIKHNSDTVGIISYKI